MGASQREKFESVPAVIYFMQRSYVIIGIDASNIRVGGGVTHLVEMLAVAEPARYGIEKVIIWSSAKTLDRLQDRQEWLIKRHVPQLDGKLMQRLLWQRRQLDQEAAREKCDILLIPGGSQSGTFRPAVAMSQNLLPFEWRELRRYGLSWMCLKMVLLRVLQSATFRRAQGVIFLSEYARQTVTRAVGSISSPTAVIPLGVNGVFFRSLKQSPRTRTPPASPASPACPAPPSSPAPPVRILYVSVVDVYKHQWHVVRAVALLRQKGYRLTLDLIGAASRSPLRRLTKVIDDVDPHREFVTYRGALPYLSLPDQYGCADINVFASSCENLPNILLEAMASNVPTACSELGPMRDVLQDAGVYFNPEVPESIADAIERLLISPELREVCARKAHEIAQKYSWQECADSTFAFLSKTHSGWLSKKVLKELS